MAQMERFLRPTPTIDSDNPNITEKAQKLIQGQQPIAEKARSIFYFVRDEIKYNPYMISENIEDHRAGKILETREGFCVQKAVLLAALARAVDIPARLRLADIRNYLVPDKLQKLMQTNLFVYHGYNELYIDGKWVKATPTFDLNMCQDNRLIPVEFDGKNNATFHPYNLDGKLHIEYVNDHGWYDDVPFDDMFKAIFETYGPRTD